MYSVIQELMLYMFELGYNAAEATKNICCAKGEGTVDHSTVNGWFKKFQPGCKNPDDQGRSGRPKTVDFEASKPERQVALKLSISQSSVVHLLKAKAKASRAAKLCLLLPKYCKTFNSL